MRVCPILLASDHCCLQSFHSPARDKELAASRSFDDGSQPVVATPSMPMHEWFSATYAGDRPPEPYTTYLTIDFHLGPILLFPVSWFVVVFD